MIKNALAINSRFKTYLQEYNIFIMFIIFIIATTIITGGTWLSPGNLFNLVSRSAILGILTIGQCIVLISGQIDLSMASLLALFCSVYSYIFLSGYSIVLSLFVASIIILIIGFINGILASRTTIPAFIITLGTMMIARSTHYYILGAARYLPEIQRIIYNFVGILPKGYELFPVLIWIITLIIFYLILNSTKLGKHVYAVGGNERTAIVTGVAVKRIKMSVFIFSAILVIIASFVFIYRVAHVAPNTGEQYLLDCIAAPIIAGVYIFGGRGKVWKAVIGALFLEVLVNFMNLIGVNPFIFPAVKGVLIAIGVIISILITPAYLKVKTR